MSFIQLTPIYYEKRNTFHIPDVFHTTNSHLLRKEKHIPYTSCSLLYIIKSSTLYRKINTTVNQFNDGNSLIYQII